MQEYTCINASYFNEIVYVMEKRERERERERDRERPES
jgi:hypothetical protein